jgi:2-(1,2-epoxy-1,2-dihydrophenyl)acetyl-CoA isomerase
MSVRYTAAEGVATVTLDRPEKLNALSEEMYLEMTRLFAQIAADDTVRGVVLTGAGRAFCAGSDLEGMQQMDVVAGRARMKRRHRMIQNLVAIEKPVIAAVNGTCVGIGFSIALACDLIVAAESARFSQIFKKIGLVPDGGSIFFLVQHLGIARAKELVYTARMLPAAEAREWGFVTRVVPDAELAGAAQALAQELAGSATHALGLAKKMFQTMYTPSLESLLELETLAQSLARLTDDHREGVTAFREKRAASFTGR